MIAILFLLRLHLTLKKVFWSQLGHTRQMLINSTMEFCVVKTSTALPDNIMAALCVQSSILLVEKSLWWEKCRSIALRFPIIGSVWQPSTKKAMYLPAEANLLLSSLIYSSNNTSSIQLYLWLLNRQGRYFTFLKQRGFCTLSTTNIGSCLSSALVEAIPSSANLNLLSTRTFIIFSMGGSTV